MPLRSRVLPCDFLRLFCPTNFHTFSTQIDYIPCAVIFAHKESSFMSRNRSVFVRTGFLLALAATAGIPLTAAADNVPPAIAALLPTDAEPGAGSWAVFETEFGKTFGGGVQASTFPGQHPSCPPAGTPELKIDIKGDTAFENPPMLDMMVAEYDKGVTGAPAALSGFINTYIKSGPDVVSVGPLKEEKRPNGYLVYVEYKEDCSSHPNGFKTRLKGMARRGATQMDVNLVVALDGNAAVAIADEILESFAELNIAALTQ
jgi:hypothetical protein